MALLDLDNIAPRLEGNSMISIPQYKIKDGKYAVYVIKVMIDSTTWTVERRYKDFVAFDLQRFEDRKKSFLPPKKLVGNLDLEFLDERRIELEKYIRTVVELDLWLQRRRKQYALPSLVAHFLDFQEYESFFRTSEERNVRITIYVHEPAEGFESGYRWREVKYCELVRGFEKVGAVSSIKTCCTVKIIPGDRSSHRFGITTSSRLGSRRYFLA